VKHPWPAVFRLSASCRYSTSSLPDSPPTDPPDDMMHCGPVRVRGGPNMAMWPGVRAARSPGRQVPAELGWRATAAGRTGTTVNGHRPGGTAAGIRRSVHGGSR
jgi:hypothetical protein